VTTYQAVNIFTFPQATKNLFEDTSLPTDIWLAIPVTLTVMSNGHLMSYTAHTCSNCI